MRVRRIMPSLGAVALLLAASFGTAEAQVPAPEELPDPPDREELVTFTEAYIVINEARVALNEEMAAAESQEEATEIQQRANETILGILEDHEIEADRYGEITIVLNNDAELRGEFEEIYEDLTEGGGLGR